MTSRNKSFIQRLHTAFRAGNAALTPFYMLRAIVNSAVAWACIYIALNLTGASTSICRFLIVNSRLLWKTAGVFCLLWPIGMVIGQFIRAFLEELFDIRDKPQRTDF